MVCWWFQWRIFAVEKSIHGKCIFSVWINTGWRTELKSILSSFQIFDLFYLISLYLLKLKNENNIFRTFNFNFFTVHQLCLTHEPCMRKLDGPLETFWSFSWWPRSRHLNEILKNTMEKKKFHLFPAWKTTLNRDSWGNGRFEGV